jgi:GntR family transcriptional regulator / MocR family aminotransferase
MLKQTNFGDDGFPSDVLVDVRPRAGAGLRERLEHGLRSAIQQQRLVAGTALPPTRVLAAELGISRSVVVGAYANLRADGYIEARRGSGTRVRLDAQHGAPRPPRANGWDYRAVYFAHPRDTSTLGVPPIRLGGGEPDQALFPRRQWVRHYRAVLTELPDPDLTYPSALGAAALRHALSAYLGRVRGVATTPERMLVCGGVTQGLTLICRALRRGGASRVAVENPCLGLHRKAIAMTGLEPVPVPGDAGGLDIDALAGHDADAVLVAPAHSYPIGGTLDARRRYDLVEWARRHDALVIEDDYDAEFRYDRLPVGALQGLAPDHVAYLGSASKTVSPSLRLGWVAAPPTLIDALEQEKRFDDMGSSLLEQLAFARFIDGGDFSRHLRRVRPHSCSATAQPAPPRFAVASRSSARRSSRPRAPVVRAAAGDRAGDANAYRPAGAAAFSLLLRVAYLLDVLLAKPRELLCQLRELFIRQVLETDEVRPGIAQATDELVQLELHSCDISVLAELDQEDDQERTDGRRGRWQDEPVVRETDEGPDGEPNKDRHCSRQERPGRADDLGGTARKPKQELHPATLRFERSRDRTDVLRKPSLVRTNQGNGICGVPFMCRRSTCIVGCGAGPEEAGGVPRSSATRPMRRFP